MEGKLKNIVFGENLVVYVVIYFYGYYIGIVVVRSKWIVYCVIWIFKD